MNEDVATIFARYESALRSIAASTCCDRCNEAKLVAHRALHPLYSSPEPRPLGTDVAPTTDGDAGSGTGDTAAEQRYAEVERRTGYDFRPRS